MNRTELLDGLYATRRELLRILVATGSQTMDGDQVKRLVEKRDQITWTINAIIDGELLASMADVDKACEAVDASTKELKHLTAIAKDIDTAINVAKKVVDVAAGAISGIAGL